jgi:hypothetical protein
MPWSIGLVGNSLTFTSGIFYPLKGGRFFQCCNEVSGKIKRTTSILMPTAVPTGIGQLAGENKLNSKLVSNFAGLLFAVMYIGNDGQHHLTPISRTKSLALPTT